MVLESRCGRHITNTQHTTAPIILLKLLASYIKQHNIIQSRKIGVYEELVKSLPTDECISGPDLSELLICHPNVNINLFVHRRYIRPRTTYNFQINHFPIFTYILLPGDLLTKNQFKALMAIIQNLPELMPDLPPDETGKQPAEHWQGTARFTYDYLYVEELIRTMSCGVMPTLREVFQRVCVRENVSGTWDW